MSEDKKQNIWMFLLSIIIVLLLIIIFLILTDRTNLNNNDNEKIEEKNNIVDNLNKNIVDEETNWKTYLLSMHLLEAKLTRTRSKDLGDTQDFNQTLTLTKEDLINILNNLQQNKLTKYYSLGTGGQARDSLTISYEKDDNKYTLLIVNDMIFVDRLDDEFNNVLDKNYVNVEQEELKDQEGSHYLYIINNYSENIYDKYFN